jgi:hypothetical protein
MIKELKAIIKVKGIATVASDLGYRSSDTLNKWFQKKNIPLIKRANVSAYIKENKK